MSVLITLAFLTANATENTAKPPVNHVFLPRGCEYTKLKNETQNDPVKMARLMKVATAQGSGTVPEMWNPKTTKERAIVRTDLKKEILYYSHETKTCEYRLLKNTPYGKWLTEMLDWRKLQKISAEVSIIPVGSHLIISVWDWRASPLSMQANFFDRVADDGYCKQKVHAPGRPAQRQATRMTAPDCYVPYSEDNRMPIEPSVSTFEDATKALELFNKD